MQDEQTQRDHTGAEEHDAARQVHQIVVFTLADQLYALELAAVERVLPMVEVVPIPDAPAVVLGVISIHGDVVPVVDVRRRFGLPSSTHGVSTQLLVARSARRNLALPVDHVLGVKEVPGDAVAPPGSILPDLGRLAGIAQLGDNLVLIHDLDAFLSLDEERSLTYVLREMRP